MKFGSGRLRRATRSLPAARSSRRECRRPGRRERSARWNATPCESLSRFVGEPRRGRENATRRLWLFMEMCKRRNERGIAFVFIRVHSRHENQTLELEAQRQARLARQLVRVREIGRVRMQEIRVHSARIELEVLVHPDHALLVEHIEHIGDEAQAPLLAQLDAALGAGVEREGPVGTAQAAAPADRDLARIVVSRVSQELADRRPGLDVPREAEIEPVKTFRRGAAILAPLLAATTTD